MKQYKHDGSMPTTVPQQKTIAAAILLLKDGLMSDEQKRGCMDGTHKMLKSLVKKIRFQSYTNDKTCIMGAHDGRGEHERRYTCLCGKKNLKHMYCFRAAPAYAKYNSCFVVSGKHCAAYLIAALAAVNKCKHARSRKPFNAFDDWCGYYD
jgi:hypothetical protein